MYITKKKETIKVPYIMERYHLHRIIYTPISFLIYIFMIVDNLFITFFSILEIYDCDIPNNSATSF